ncbi:MAG: hypothetical protein M1831_004269 [Alyxoria varia]|nr:MAG: hypothetical protein M1831_004269 [Alyxoria varia]
MRSRRQRPRGLQSPQRSTIRTSPKCTRTNHDRIPINLLIFTTFALLPHTTTAITLSDFAPRASNLTPSCRSIYRAPISGCDPSDFAGGRPCTQPCMNALNRATDVVWNVCGGDSRNDDGIISAFLKGSGVEALCPNVKVASEGSGTLDMGVSTRVEETPTPVPVPAVGAVPPPPDSEPTPYSNAYPSAPKDSTNRPPPERTQDAPSSTYARRPHRSTSTPSPSQEDDTTIQQTQLVTRTRERTVRQRYESLTSSSDPTTNPSPSPSSSELPYITIPESGSASYPSSQTKRPTTTSTEGSDSQETAAGTNVAADPDNTDVPSGVCGDGSLVDDGECWGQGGQDSKASRMGGSLGWGEMWALCGLWWIGVGLSGLF